MVKIHLSTVYPLILRVMWCAGHHHCPSASSLKTNNSVTFHVFDHEVHNFNCTCSHGSGFWNSSINEKVKFIVFFFFFFKTAIKNCNFLQKKLSTQYCKKDFSNSEIAQLMNGLQLIAFFFFLKKQNKMGFFATKNLNNIAKLFQ